MKKILHLNWMFSLMILSVLAFSACKGQKVLNKSSTGKPEAPVLREFRAAWVATVANINWPSKPGISTEQQKAEAIQLLDFLKEHNFNAVIFQVRPQSDALYESKLEPWSYYLTGKQGLAPKPYYDPLEFWIEESHKRGLELHVWLNPYRAHHVSGKEVTENSLVKRMPESVVHLAEGYWWFDPSLKSTQDHSSAVVKDLVKRYNIDGVHFDDYFYPYESYNKGVDFPDDKSWRAYTQSGGKLNRGDWRRSHVNNFIERVYKEIKDEKPHVKFGLSPFGIWRPGYPEGIAGMDQYSTLYADAKLWLNRGWIDYFSPQLYWPISRLEQSFPVLLGWWQEENTHQRHLWPGMSVDQGGNDENVKEVINQIMVTRGIVPKSKGAIHWSISSLTKNPKIPAGLKAGPYKKQALIPASPWLNKGVPAKPKVSERTRGENVELSWSHSNKNDIANWVVYFKHGERWDYSILPYTQTEISLPTTKNGQKITEVYVTAINKAGIESL